MTQKGLVYVACTLLLILGLAAHAQEMAKPEMTTISGKIIDLTCASKAQAMMGSWVNTEDTHMMPGGKEAPGCATMCLKGGQPAALFQDDAIAAVFACNPRATLADYAAQEVEVEGFWGGSAGDAIKTFVPTKIRATGGGDWQEVDCATMHG